MRRLYRLALRAFPSSHRALFGDEMLDAFERALDARRRDRLPVLPFAVAAYLDATSAQPCPSSG